MFLLAIMGTVTLGTLLRTARPSKQATYREQAIYRASARFAECKSQTLTPGDLPVTRETLDEIVFVTSVRVEKVDGYEPEDLRKLTVEVRWDDHVVSQIGWIRDAGY